MFIIWGTKIKREPRGVVADQCPSCLEVRCFSVIDHYEFDHIYFLSVGRGTRVASTRKCWRCGNEFTCVPLAYQDFIPEATAKVLTLDQVIERTNTPLADIRATRKHIETMAYERPSQLAGDLATQMMVPGTPLREVPTLIHDAELREALGRLEVYEGGDHEVPNLLQKLKGLRGLDSGDRSALLQEVNAFIEGRQKRDRAIGFLDKMLRSFPQYLGWFPALGLTAALGAGFIWINIYCHPCVVLSYGAFAIAAVSGCYIYSTKAIRRRWMRDTAIPQADEAGVDLKTLATVMADLAKLEGRIDGKLLEMTSEAWLLEELTVARWDSGQCNRNWPASTGKPSG